MRYAVTHGHLATKRGRHYASLSVIVIGENALMTGVSPNDSMTAKPNDHEHYAPCAYYLYIFGLLGHLSVELVRINDKTLMGGLADLVHLVEAFHLVGKLLAVNFN